MDLFQGIWKHISVENVHSCLSEIYVSITLCTILPYFSFLKEKSSHLTFVTLMLLSNLNIFISAMIFPKYLHNVCHVSQRDKWILNIWISRINLYILQPRVHLNLSFYHHYCILLKQIDVKFSSSISQSNKVLKCF